MGGTFSLGDERYLSAIFLPHKWSHQGRRKISPVSFANAPPPPRACHWALRETICLLLLRLNECCRKTRRSAYTCLDPAYRRRVPHQGSEWGKGRARNKPDIGDG
jgi:hypothetical protein